MPDIMSFGKHPDYMGAIDLADCQNGEVTLTIASITEKSVNNGRGESSKESVCAWQEKGLCQARFAENKTVRAIEDYIRANAHLRITAKEAAKHVNVSYSYMARLLSEARGVGFCDYLLSVRVDMAKKMLTSTEMSVTDVGYECGFPATSAFIQSFKKLTGKTPLSYRKTAKKF